MFTGLFNTPQHVLYVYCSNEDTLHMCKQNYFYLQAKQFREPSQIKNIKKYYRVDSLMDRMVQKNRQLILPSVHCTVLSVKLSTPVLKLYIF